MQLPLQSNFTTFPSLEKEIPHPFVVSIFPTPQVTTNLFSASMNLSILDTLYKWNHTVCGLFLSAFKMQFDFHDFFSNSSPLFTDSHDLTKCFHFHVLMRIKEDNYTEFSSLFENVT